MMSRYTLDSQKTKQPQRLWVLALASVVMLGAVSTQAAIAFPRHSRPLTAQLRQQPSKTRLPQQVIQRIQRELAQQLNVTPRTLQVVSFSRETWGDSCLGLAADNERCAMATVEGWRVEVTNGQQNWVYRTDLKAQVIRLETKDKNSVPPVVIDRLFEAIAKQTGVPASTLKIVESRAATWNGCMGIYVPDQVCTEIAISGWQIIVAGENQSWIYHVSEDASRIVQNSTASGARGEIMTLFIPAENQQYGRQSATQVFRTIESGGMAGIVTERFLMSDGVIYKRTWRMSSGEGVEPVVEKRISEQQVKQFFQLVQQQRFPNLNGLRYITSAALADYPTTTLLAMGNAVEYIDLEKDSLPSALQAVIQAWERL